MSVKLDSSPLIGPPLHPIAYVDIKEMTTYYQSTMPSNDQTKSCWVSVNELMSLISANQANGIRMYYGRHAASHPQYPGQHNIILVATFDSVNPQNPTTQNSIDLLNYNPQTGATNTVSYSGDGGDSVPLCPPACPTSGGL